MLLTQELNGTSVGLVASKKRNIKDGSEFDRFFAQPVKTDPVLRGGIDPRDTVGRLMPDIIERTKGQTSQIAITLTREKLQPTLKAIWEFVYNHIQYRNDNRFIEQLRHPVRAWADRKTGVDCDCYAIFISTILCNLRIPHALRMAGYNKQRGWQHVYVIVPKFNGANLRIRDQYYTIDCVLEEFNAEKPYIMVFDRTILGGDNNSGLYGLGSPINYKNRTNLCTNDIFYSTGLGTWAVRCLDGSFAIQGNPKVRYVPSTPDSSLDGLFATAIKLGGKLVKGVVKKVATKVKEKAAKTVTNGKEAVKEVKSTAQNAVKEAKQNVSNTKQDLSNLKNVYTQQGTELKSSLLNLQDAVNNGASTQELESLLKKTSNIAVMATDKTKTAAESAIKNVNNNMIRSLDKLSVDEKKHLDEQFDALQPQLKDIEKTAATTEQLKKDISTVTALSKGSQQLTQNLEKSNKITQYILVAVALLAAMAFFIKKKNHN